MRAVSEQTEYTIYRILKRLKFLSDYGDTPWTYTCNLFSVVSAPIETVMTQALKAAKGAGWIQVRGRDGARESSLAITERGRAHLTLLSSKLDISTILRTAQRCEDCGKLVCSCARDAAPPSHQRRSTGTGRSTKGSAGKPSASHASPSPATKTAGKRRTKKSKTS
jgi:hypothetical protein